MPLVTPARRSRIRRRVLAWYAARGRPLAFRRTTDPWLVLVSEVMAQQTQAARAADAWERFTARWPTPGALAEAATADVLREWRGLGYNRRAVALQRAARAIVAEHGGRVPDDLRALGRLPGIGPYSARAVAALAFGRRVGAVDTNVRRVLGRAFFGTRTPHAAALQVLADALVPARQPGVWTHALMDVGATVCRIREPRCAACPLQSWCVYTRLTPPAFDVIERSRVVGPPAARFEATSRWLRGRLLDRLREAGEARWVTVTGPIGQHDTAAIAVALDAMARDGLVELGAEPATARLPVGEVATLRA
ncbi:MAG TPA: A/G-specific adenine glycosylase [Candidatus Limnocylindrales bacterium]